MLSKWWLLWQWGYGGFSLSVPKMPASLLQEVGISWNREPPCGAIDVNGSGFEARLILILGSLSKMLS